MKIDIRSLSENQIIEFFEQKGFDSYRGKQVYEWIWKKSTYSFDEMTNLSKDLRLMLDSNFVINHIEVDKIQKSSDGTIKNAVKLFDDYTVESVLIPTDDRTTACVSSQVGCSLDCKFCATSKLKRMRNLNPDEIYDQVVTINNQSLKYFKRSLSNIVFMGMGEPLHNFDNLVVALRNMLHDHALNLSHRKITVSTVGLIPALVKLSKLLPVNLAISLNATTEHQRQAVMPINHKYSLRSLLETCANITLPRGKRIAFEYVLMAGFNDSMDDAQRLFDLLRNIPAKVNLIPYNENPDRDIQRPSPDKVKAFQHYLVQRVLLSSIRTSRGKDISAACGQLGKTVEGMNTEQEQHAY